MDVTNETHDGGRPAPYAGRRAQRRAHLDVTVWWSCAGCGVDVELPAAHTVGFLLPCPDCSGPLHEMWRWEPVSA